MPEVNIFWKSEGELSVRSWEYCTISSFDWPSELLSWQQGRCPMKLGPTDSSGPCTLLPTSTPSRKMDLAWGRGHPARYTSRLPLRLLNNYNSGEKCLLQRVRLLREVFQDMYFSYLLFLGEHVIAWCRSRSLSHALCVYEQRHSFWCFLYQLKHALTRTKRMPPMWLAIDQAFEFLVLWIWQT